MSSFERKNLSNGEQNPKYIDLCDEDQPISGQKFTCISFISPERVLKKREIFTFDEFLKQWEFKKSTDKFFDFINFIAYKYSINLETLVQDYTDFVKDEEVKLKENGVVDDFNTFLDKNEERLNEKFNKENGFQTSVRGLKIRGSFNTQEEAEMNCKKLRDIDPNHDIFVGPVGIWIPWDPDAYKTGKIEFMEEELNQLHNEKIKNEAKAKEDFEKRIRDTKRKAIQDNIDMAKKSGNILTQTIDENDNLIGVKETTNFEDREAADVDTTSANEKIMNDLKNAIGEVD